MATPDPCINDYVRIANIYTDGRLSDGELFNKARHYQQANSYKTITLGFLSYLRGEFNVPIQFWPEIIQLNRKLSPLEIEALMLKEKLQKESEPNIRISIEGLE